MSEKKLPITELVFILDKSGSMSGLEADTVGGFNSNLKKHRGEEGRTYVTTVLFSTGVTVLHDRQDVSDVSDMTADDFTVGGCTALYDAVGEQIEHISTVHRYIREEDLPDSTVFIIMTDGYENASVRYSHERLRKMISEKREKGWEFIFLGANIDTESVASGLGMNEKLASSFRATSEGVSDCLDDMYCFIDRAKKETKRGGKK